jgi:alpha-L-fucosidase 2
LKTTFLHLSILLLFGSFTFSFAQIPPSDVDWPVFMARQNLKWDSISTNYYTGIILGNGLLGANIYKGSDSTIRFDVGRSDVSDQRERLFPKVGKLYTNARLAIGYFSIKTAGKILGAKMELDIYNAEAKGKIFTTMGN